MKKFLFSVLLTIWSICSYAQGAVSVEATEGGSITFTPSGVVRTAPKVTTRSVAVTKAPTKAPKTAVPDTAKVRVYKFTNLTVADARLVFNAYRGIKDDENATAKDIATFEAIRKFIVDNRDFGSSTKRLNVDVPAEKLDRIFGYSTWHNRQELQKQLNLLNREEVLFNQAKAQEMAAGVNQYSVVQRLEYKFQ